MSALLEAVDAEFAVDDYQPRSEVTMSMLGRCRRQAAYALNSPLGAGREGGGGSAQAVLGTGTHHYLLPRLAERLGGDWEVPVTYSVMGIEIKGSADLVLADEVVDLKTVSCHWYDVVSARIPHGNRLQATAYALARKVSKASLLYVNRCNGQRFVETWNPEDYRFAIEEWLAGAMGDPQETERDERGPGLSMVCDSCPFVKNCWGPVRPEQKPQGIVVNESGSVALALRSYDEARAAEKEAKETKDFWRQALEGTPADDYETFSLSWSGGKERESFDADEAKRLLLAAGLPVPMKRKVAAVSIGVKARRD